MTSTKRIATRRKVDAYGDSSDRSSAVARNRCMVNASGVVRSGSDGLLMRRRVLRWRRGGYIMFGVGGVLVFVVGVGVACDGCLG